MIILTFLVVLVVSMIDPIRLVIALLCGCSLRNVWAAIGIAVALNLGLTIFLDVDRQRTLQANPFGLDFYVAALCGMALTTWLIHWIAHRKRAVVLPPP